MTTKFVKFPPEQEAKAIAYEAECTAQLRIMTGNPEDIWLEVIRQDKNSNWTVPLYGPPWVYDVNVGEVEEPESCALLRADGVVVETPEWPPSPDD